MTSSGKLDSFLWGKYFETGLDDVDDQHRYLVEMINRYGELIAENSVAISDIQAALFELSRYAQFHFKEEEAMMRQAGIHADHFEEHIAIHQAFISDVIGMQSFIDAKDSTAASQLLQFLIHWLAYHILGIDQNMARQIKAIEAGLTPQQAYDQEERESDASTAPLLQALNALFKQVSERNRQLLALNQDLENIVEQRTQQLRSANKQLEVLSCTDLLTQLPNRRFAMQTLGKLWDETSRSQCLVCIMVDADNFKYVNDQFGHDVGDKVLIELAKALQYQFRSDDIVTRLGGDEFLVICPNTDLKGGVHIAEMVRQHVNQLQVETGFEPWNGSISVGVAQRDHTMTNYTQLIQLADKALYHAKRTQRNCVCSSAMLDDIHE